jgi:hypothetical protein
LIRIESSVKIKEEKDMKISQLERQSHLAAVPLSEDNSYVILNYAANDSDAAVTSRVTLKELSNMMINNHNLM